MYIYIYVHTYVACTWRYHIRIQTAPVSGDMKCVDQSHLCANTYGCLSASSLLSCPAAKTIMHLCRLMAKTCVSSLRKKKGICTYRGGRYGKRSFGSRLLELAKQMKQASRTKQMKQALSLVKTCVQRETSSVAVITTLQELLRVEAADPGAYLLAEYVASRCGIKLRSSLFLKKANPVWHVRRGRSAVI